MPTPGQGWLISRRYDLWWFAVPGVVSAAVGLAWGLSGETRQEDSLALWIVGVLLVDVAHVYASLYRTYFDADQRARHRERLIWAPIVCLLVGVSLHALSGRLFWSVLAYLAIFHFIKQHVGFAKLYARPGDESAFDRRLIDWAVWAGTLCPVLWWHANLPRRFSWFMGDDLLRGMPELLGTVAVWAQAPVLLAFVVRRVQLHTQGRRNPMVPLLVLLPALNWNLGIVWFNDDRIFTVTNVFLHGIPYLALVWVTGGRETVERAVPRRAGVVAAIAAFYGLLVALAYAEEGLWDRLVWHDHPQLFGETNTELEGIAAAVIVALLTVPQATHYLLDRWIWRPGPSNPELARQLGLTR